MGQQNPAGFTPDPEGFTPDKEPPNRTDLILANPLETPRDIPPVKSEIKPNSMFQNIMDWGNRSLFTGEDAPTPMDYFRNPRGSWERGLDTALTSPFAIGGELLGGIGLLKGVSRFRNAGKVAEEIPVVNKAYGPADYATDNAFLRARGQEVPQQLKDLAGEAKINPVANKPRFKINLDGTATNLDTGEIVQVPKSKFEGAPVVIPKFKGNKKGIKLEDAQAGFNKPLPATPQQNQEFIELIKNHPSLDEIGKQHAINGINKLAQAKPLAPDETMNVAKVFGLGPPEKPPNVPPSGDNIPPEIPPIPNIHDEFMGRLENEGLFLKAASLMKGSKATGDLGPMFRQGIAYTGRPAWNKALVQQFKSFFSEGAHETFRAKLQTHPLMVKDANGISEADRMGLYIPELGTLTKEEAQAGLDLTEKVWGKAKLGFIPRSSNRAFADSIASLRINVAQSLKERYGALYESMLKEAQLNPGKAKEILTDAEQFNPKNNLVLERIGEEVNSASGRGNLKIKGRSIGGQKLYDDINLGKYADAANVTLFSPRLIQSRLNTINRTLNPFSYLKQDPVMRKEHLKQLLSITGAITASDTLYSMFGGEVGTEPTSSDFGKSRFGNITIDSTGGLGKYGTLEERLRRQELTSAQSKRVFKLGSNPVIGDSTTLLGNFAKGTLSPAATLALEIISTGGRSFTGRDAVGQPAKFNSPNPFENPLVRDTVIPMIYQDIYEIIQEDPSYLPLIFPDAMGQGVNVFNKDRK